MTDNQIDGYSKDLKQDRLEQLKKLMPELFSEGNFDPDKLKEFFQDGYDPEERYHMTWAGRKDSIRQIQIPTSDTLKPAKDESLNFDETENIFIEGDNLNVLKALQRSYYGKIKMIYIDPPYNTGNDSFIYPDKFQESKDEYLERIGDKDEEGYIVKGGMFHKNTKESGHYHSNWLSMMYPRLFLARNLLKDDGVIFISIDDHEVHNLRKICDEIFGEENCLAELVWRKKSSGGQHSSTFLDFHEYIVVYAKNYTFLGDMKVARSEKQLESFKFEDEYVKTRGKHLLSPLKSWLDERKTLIYPIECPDGTFIKTQWVCSYDTYIKLLNEGRIEFKKTSSGWSIYKKQYSLENGGEVKSPSILLDVGQTQNGKRELKALFENKEIMSFPKPVSLIKYVISLLEYNKNDIILDFFAGSGTIAHAVMDLNVEDNGNRKWICVQLPENTDEKSEAYKAGYENISDIAKERIRRAGKNIVEEKKEKLINELNKKKITQVEYDEQISKLDNLDTGFKVFKLDESNFKQRRGDKIKTEEELNKQLQLFQNNIDENVSGFDIVYELLLKMGTDLNASIVDKGKYFVIDEVLIICLEDNISQELVDEIVALKPQRVICKDKGFRRNDQLKTNMKLQLESASIDFKTI